MVNGDLDEQIFMKQLEGFVKPESEHLVCKLKRSLYGLKHTPRHWYKLFGSYRCVYVKSLKNGSFIFLLSYVDDMLNATKILLY